MDRWTMALLIGLAAEPASALAGPAVSCGGFALLGGAQINCSHVDPEAPTQFCTFSWTLMTGQGPSVVGGSFQVPPGASNVTVYQGGGFTSQASEPVVLCQGRKG